MHVDGSVVPCSASTTAEWDTAAAAVASTLQDWGAKLIRETSLFTPAYKRTLGETMWPRGTTELIRL